MRSRFDFKESRKERQRRFVSHAIVFIFVLSLIEGPLRKWFLPEFASAFIFLRDPFVLSIYGYCFARDLFPKDNLFRVWMIFAIASSMIGTLVYLVVHPSAIGWALGVRSYWLYMPLAFIVASCFTTKDLKRFVSIVLAISLPYAVLISMQYRAGPEAFINAGVGADSEAAVLLVGDLVRPLGLFRFTAPNVQFTEICASVLQNSVISRATLNLNRILVLLGLISIPVMTVLTGSRLIYFILSGVIVTVFVGSILAPQQKRSLNSIVSILAIFGVSSFALLAVFPDMAEAMLVRLENAERSEGSIWNRAMSTLVAIYKPIHDGALFGYGIGAGASGVALYLGYPALIFGENEFERTMNELGIVLGLGFVLLRWGTLVVVFRRLVLARGSLATGGFAMLGFSSISFGAGQITHSPMIGFLPWLSLGLALAIAKQAKQGLSRTQRRVFVNYAQPERRGQTL